MSVKKFLSDTTGAVTVDWVALAAGLLLVSVPIISLIQDEFAAVVANMEFIYPTSLDVSPPSGSS